MIRILVIGCLIILIGCGTKTTLPLNIEIEDTILYFDGKVVLCLADGRKMQLAGIKVSTFESEAPAEQRDTIIEHRGIARYELQALLSRNRIRVQYTTETTENSLPQGYVYIDDIFINAELIKRGYAYAVSTPSNSKYNAMFESLEKEAKTTRKGLWVYWTLNKYEPLFLTNN